MRGVVEITPALLARMPPPRLSEHSDKNERGRILVVAGGAQVPGAAILAGLAALRVGAGKLQLAATEATALALGIAVPEARVLRVPATAAGEIGSSADDALRNAIANNDSIVLGPGMLDETEAGALALAILHRTPASLVLDAGALTGLRGRGQGAPSPGATRVVMTPHTGELAKLMNWSVAEIHHDPVSRALITAAQFASVVVLKGAYTFVATPEGEVLRNTGGVPGLGTSGSGDVLAGLIGGLLARGLGAKEAAAWGVFLHAQAGAQLAQEIGSLGFLAREVLNKIPFMLSKLCDATD